MLIIYSSKALTNVWLYIKIILMMCERLLHKIFIKIIVPDFEALAEG